MHHAPGKSALVAWGNPICNSFRSAVEWIIGQSIHVKRYFKSLPAFFPERLVGVPSHIGTTNTLGSGNCPAILQTM